MNRHKGARTTPYSRMLIVQRVTQEHQSVAQVAATFGISHTTVGKWLRRAKTAGSADPAALTDRSSRPHRLRAVTPAETVAQIEAARRQHRSGRQLATAFNRSPATISRILRRAQLSRAKDLVPVPPPNRYEHDTPGALLHFDSKTLGRFTRPGHRLTGDRRGSNGRAAVGTETVHVAIDDHSRLAHIQVLADASAQTAVRMLTETVAWYRQRAIPVAAILTDNGGCYRSRAFAAACAELGLIHRFTRPYTPRTNGKAERLIQTAMREWAYVQTYETSDQRAAALPGWVQTYNTTRPHSGIGGVPPMTRIDDFRNNLLKSHM